MKQVHVTCITYKPCNERKDDVLTAVSKIVKRHHLGDLKLHLLSFFAFKNHLSSV